MTDLLFIAPNKTRYRTQLKRIGMPIGMLSMASVLSAKGFDTEFIDASAEGFDLETITELTSPIDGARLYRYGLSDEEILKRISDIKPKIIALGNLSSSLFQTDVDLGMIIKKEFPNIPIITGGYHVSANQKQAIETGAFDYVIVGEGEHTLLELVQNLFEKKSTNSDIRKIKGLAYKNHDNDIFTGIRPPISEIDLNTLPIPRYDFVKNIQYCGKRFHGGEAKHIYIAEFFTERGCPYSCNFCAVNVVHGRTYRKYSQDYVKKHLDQLVTQGYEEIAIEDDNFAADKSRARSIMCLLKERELDWTEIGGIGIKQLTKEEGEPDYEFIQSMADNGCYRIYLAIESNNEESMKQANKSKLYCSPDITHNVIKALKNSGIETFGGLIIGFPNESMKDIMNTVHYAKSLVEAGMHYAILFHATPVPGTKFAKDQEKNITGILADYCFERSNYDSPFVSAKELNNLRSEFMRIANGKFALVWEEKGIWPTK